MRIEKTDKFNILYADEGKQIRAINDVYKKAYIDENGFENEEYVPNYFEKAYVPFTINEDNMNEHYVEEKIGSLITTEQKAEAYDILVGEVE